MRQKHYLGSLSSNFSSTSQGSVHLSSEQRDGQVNGHVLQGRDIDLVLKRRSGAEEVELKQFAMLPFPSYRSPEGAAHCSLHLLAVNTLEHGELCPQLGHIGLRGDLEDMGLASVDDQLHRDTILLLKHWNSHTRLHWPLPQNIAVTGYGGFPSIMIILRQI